MRDILIYANDPEHGRIRATPKARASCPACQAAVRAKCGAVTSWHWAHVAGADCDTFSEPMTAWHREWQETVPEDCREVVLGPHRADILAPLGVVVELQHSTISVEDIEKREAFYDRMIWVFDALGAYDQDQRRRCAKSNSAFETAREQHIRQHPETGCPTCKRLNYPGIPWMHGRERLLWTCTEQALGRRGLRRVWPDCRLDVRRSNRPDGYATFRWKHPRKSIGFCAKPVFLDLGNDELLRLGRIHTGAPCGGWGHLISKASFVAQINGRAA